MIRMLEANGHDVIAVAKIDQGATDTPSSISPLASREFC